MYRDGRDVDVLLLVEHRDRELELVAALARRLREDHGLTVAVASRIFEPWLALFAVRPRVVVGTSTKREPCWVSEMFRRLYGGSIRHAFLNWEQMLNPLNLDLRRPVDTLTRDTARHFAWGDTFAAFLVDSGVSPDRVFLTGKPTMALLEDKVRRRDEVKRRLAARHGLDPEGRWLLVATTCHYAFFSDGRLRRRAGRGRDIGTLVALRAYIRATLEDMLGWLAAYGPDAARTNTTIILRPHPFVTEAQHRRLFERRVGGVPPHVRILKDATAYDWLVASEACFTNYSTVALDANGIGWPAYLMEPRPFPASLATDWLDDLPRLRDEAAFLEAARAPRAAPKTAAFQRHAADHPDPIGETAARLAAMAGETTRGRWSWTNAARALSAHPRLSAISVARYIIQACGLTPLLQPAYANDGFSRAELRALIRR